MEKGMKVLSLFSGVGGFDMGLEAAGMTTVFQCEIDKHARAVLDYHWPDIPKWDDVTTLTGRHILDHTDGVDLVAWGSPCQDLSLAGKRAGLAGERSGLFHEGIRIIKELRELSNGRYPTWSVWENVVGALSSNGGADFGEVLGQMDEAGACFSEWAVLDAQYFGVPQRRRRVFVVSCFDPATAAGCPDKILAVGESRRGDSAKGKPSGKDAAGEVAESPRTGGEREIVGTIGPTFGSKNYSNIQEVSQGSLVVQNPVLIDRAAFNQGENALYEPVISDDPVTPALVARGPHAVGQDVPLSFDTQFGSNANVFEDQAPTLKASQQSPSVAYGIVDDETVALNLMPTMPTPSASGGGHPPAVAYTIRDREGKPGDGSDNLVVEPAAIDFRHGTINTDVASTIQAKPNGGYSLNFIPGVLQDVVHEVPPRTE